jgi:hypothetical protein
MIYTHTLLLIVALFVTALICSFTTQPIESFNTGTVTIVNYQEVAVSGQEDTFILLDMSMLRGNKLKLTDAKTFTVCNGTNCTKVNEPIIDLDIMRQGAVLSVEGFDVPVYKYRIEVHIPQDQIVNVDSIKSEINTAQKYVYFEKSTNIVSDFELINTISGVNKNVLWSLDPTYPDVIMNYSDSLKLQRIKKYV